MQNHSILTRRQFLGHTACAGLSLTGIFNALGTLRLMNATLSAQAAPLDDYKAIICLFMFGGNDANNMLIPFDDENHAAYIASRDNLGLPKVAPPETPDTPLILPLNGSGGDGREYAVHPNMSPLRTLFNEGKLAFLSNVGTLVAPITRAEYRAGGAAIPPYLFSHNDQQLQWQTSLPASSRKIGWGGRLADLLKSLNEGSQLSMNISIAGNNYFQVGNEVFQYHISTNGTVGLRDYTSTNAPARQQYRGLSDNLGMTYSHLFEAEYASILNRAISTDDLVRTTLGATPRFDRTPPADGSGPNDQNLFPTARGSTGSLTGLASQLHMILRLIHAQSALSMRRQIFFCSIGGFDTHDNQIVDHANLMRTVSNAVHDFYRATETLGFADKITLFTASDFNRTYSSNGKGSDHAWGGAQFVIGGGVDGGKIYGRMPILQSGGPDDTGNRGNWIPSISTDEYAATIAKWFGVAPANMPLVLPNIGRFALPDLGFYRAGV
jgi:uncharacterized protein (DUF1501 family)